MDAFSTIKINSSTFGYLYDLRCDRKITESGRINLDSTERVHLLFL